MKLLLPILCCLCLYACQSDTSNTTTAPKGEFYQSDKGWHATLPIGYRVQVLDQQDRGSVWLQDIVVRDKKGNSMTVNAALLKDLEKIGDYETVKGKRYAMVAQYYQNKQGPVNITEGNTTIKGSAFYTYDAALIEATPKFDNQLYYESRFGDVVFWFTIIYKDEVGKKELMDCMQTVQLVQR